MGTRAYTILKDKKTKDSLIYYRSMDGFKDTIFSEFCSDEKWLSEIDRLLAQKNNFSSSECDPFFSILNQFKKTLNKEYMSPSLSGQAALLCGFSQYLLPSVSLGSEEVEKVWDVKPGAGCESDFEIYFNGKDSHKKIKANGKMSSLLVPVDQHIVRVWGEEEMCYDFKTSLSPEEVDEVLTSLPFVMAQIAYLSSCSSEISDEIKDKMKEDVKDLYFITAAGVTYFKEEQNNISIYSEGRNILGFSGVTSVLEKFLSAIKMPLYHNLSKSDDKINYHLLDGQSADLNTPSKISCNMKDCSPSPFVIRDNLVYQKEHIALSPEKTVEKYKEISLAYQNMLMVPMGPSNMAFWMYLISGGRIQPTTHGEQSWIHKNEITPVTQYRSLSERQGSFIPLDERGEARKFAEVAVEGSARQLHSLIAMLTDGTDIENQATASAINERLLDKTMKRLQHGVNVCETAVSLIYPMIDMAPHKVWGETVIKQVKEIQNIANLFQAKEKKTPSVKKMKK